MAIGAARGRRGVTVREIPQRMAAWFWIGASEVSDYERTAPVVAYSRRSAVK
jgi:hypothetical protein